MMKTISSAPFTKSTAHINDEHVDNADNLDIAMPIYKLTEYSNKYSDISGSLWQFKRDESPVNNDANPVDFSTANATSFKYNKVF